MFSTAHSLPRSARRRASSAIVASICAVAVLVGLSPVATARCNAYDEVYLFEQPGCLPCMAVKRLLAQHGIGYQSRDARTPENSWYMRTYAGASGTPVVTIGNQTDGYRHVVGYNERLLREYLCLY